MYNTNKVVQVNNERNTKYTFNVTDPTNADSVINLIVVDVDGDIIEYFIQYIFDPNNPAPQLPSGVIDMARFTGGMTFYNTEGTIIGNFLLNDGDLVDFEGEIDPCPEDEVVEEEEGDDDDSNNSSGAGGGTPPDDTSNPDDTGYNPGNSGAGWFENVDEPCGFIITYQECCNGSSGCDGNADGHGSENCGCGNGSPTTIKNTCNGNSVTFRTIMGNSSPCDGAVGVLLPLDDCEVSNDTFNSIYSNNSPFNVDLSSVREDCNAVGIDMSLVSANAKFMCIYNKLVNSPKFKDLFIDTFGESEDLNVKFEITDTLDEETLGTTSGNVISQGDDVLEINQVIKLNKGMFDSSSNIQKTPIEIAIVIIHESIHAFLNIKKYNCDNGSSIEELNNMLLHELLNEFFDGSCIPEQEQHEFMFNYLLPTMEQILQDIKDDTIPLNQQEFLNYVNFYNELDENNPLDESHPFDFNELFHYLSMVGLQETQSMIDNFNNNPIDEYLYGEYRTQANTVITNLIKIIMKRLICFFIFYSLIINSYACVCDDINPTLEFYESEYVFEGVITSKEYAIDSLTYKVTFDILHYYKKTSKAAQLEFVLKSESKYTGIVTSCDWSVNINQKWLVYAKIVDDKLSFNYYCSNSKPLNCEIINSSEKKILKNGNEFKIDDFIYKNEASFSNSKPISNIDSIIKKGLIKNYDKSFTVLKLLIDKKGDLKSVATNRNFYLVSDSIFNLPVKFILDDSIKMTEFENDAIYLGRQIKKWEIKKHNKTGIAVSYIRNLILQYNKDKGQWEYEL